MEHNLPGAADLADYLVDLSNVVRDRSLGAPGVRSLHRFRLVVQALVRLTGDPDVPVYPVADASLLGGAREFTDPGDVATLRRWVEEGLVEEVGDADRRILELMEMTSAAHTRTVTGDLLVGHRREHPWIQGNTDRFLKPVAGPSGSVRLVPLDMGVRTQAEISRNDELAAFKKQGLLLKSSQQPISAVIKRFWRCPERRCSLYDPRSGRVLLPRMRGGVPTCEVHSLPLADAGPRPAMAQLKAMVNGGCAARYTVEEGSRTAVGRNPEGGIALYALLSPQVAARVSREHVVVSTTDGILRVRDVSTYGTRMRAADRRGRLGPWERLTRDKDRRFGPGDEVELAPGVVLTRSGRRFPAELATAWRTGPKGPSAPPEASMPTSFR
ncbi:FHA domain-containing protein [Streptomyces triculaminicus]|uniref:FHA domain-containing protein n=1 Tax=Streptomyces triculaminicus TaxID=2816232 RepID=A0A939FN40_9ACTN|nr:FHA domain-containing protein [Streptomyces triculaminicus]MBO0654287.1 FHA domain-containing protein [Streptomyces triculaminicus]